MKKIVSVALGLLLFAGGAKAYVVTNGSFEDPMLTGPPNDIWATIGVVPNWGSPGGTAFGILHPNLTPGMIPNAPAGNQWLWLRDAYEAPWIHGAVNQNVGTIPGDNEDIVVSFWLGTRGDYPQATVRLGLYSWTAIDGYTEISTTDILAPATQGIAFHTVTKSTGTGHAGKDLVIAFNWVGGAPGAQALVDDVTVIPEPATVGLMGLGLAAVLALPKGTGRRKR